MSLETKLPTQIALPGYSLVTVVFEAEFELLCLQARSIARYCPATVIAEILVIDNSEKGMARNRRSRLLASYGPMQSHVRFVKREEFPFIPSTNGYLTQQLLKLLVADLVATRNYVVLDAKSHLVRPLTREFLEAEDGRPRIRLYPYIFHPLRIHLLNALEVFHLNRESYLEAFTPTVPPFTMVTSIARELVRSDPTKTGQEFARTFLERGLTEFFTYSAYLLQVHGSFESVYCCDQPECPIVWGGTPSARTLLQVLEKSSRDETPFFAIHRRALESSSPKFIGTVARFWVAHGLFGSRMRAVAFILRTGMRSRFARWTAQIRKAASNSAFKY